MRPEETIDYHVRAVWYGIFRMYNQLGLAHDITTSLGFVLLNIHSETGTPATKIAPLMGMESRSLSRMLKSMEEKGLIYKQQDEQDRRSVRIFLTEEGKRRKAISGQTVRTFNEKMHKVIPQKDFDAFFRVMTTVNQYVNNFDKAE
jgi:MarR family transcriptional regulator, organic hydroperoxide resistance regulator